MCRFPLQGKYFMCIMNVNAFVAGVVPAIEKLKDSIEGSVLSAHRMFSPS